MLGRTPVAGVHVGVVGGATELRGQKAAAEEGCRPHPSLEVIGLATTH